MAYRDFDFKGVLKKFDLVEKRITIFDDLKRVEPSAWLNDTFAYSLELALASGSEKARSEFIVVPILLEMERRNNKSFAIHSGINLDVDKQKGLNGECDFILSRGEISYALRAPIFALMEAKKNNIESALGQCIAQMIGARVFNENEANEIDTIFGCVTTGEAWQFMKLVSHTIFIDQQRYYINEVGQILGFLQEILSFYET